MRTPYALISCDLMGARKGLFPKKGKEESQEDTDDDAGHEGEVEGELIPLDIDITGEPPDPGDLIAEDQEQPYNHEADAKDDEDLS
jgi:hypothetical protein